jgi:UDP-N-acetylmuramate dehydrogenase
MIGKAKVIKPAGLSNFVDLIQYFLESGRQFKVIGGGSNTIIRDNLKIPLIITKSVDGLKIDGNYIIAESGVKLSKIISETIERGLSGLEFAIGIPGTVGGATYMNTGAFDGEMSKCIECVEVIDTNGKCFELHHDDLKFSYRSSIFHDENLWIKKCILKLKFSHSEDVRRKLQENWERKSTTQPLSLPSVGCIFKNPKNKYAAKLIDDANLKGLKIGDVEVSTVHAGFFVNKGRATFEDFQEVYTKVIEEVKAKFGVELEPEITII